MLTATFMCEGLFATSWKKRTVAPLSAHLQEVWERRGVYRDGQERQETAGARSGVGHCTALPADWKMGGVYLYLMKPWRDPLYQDQACRTHPSLTFYL